MFDTLKEKITSLQVNKKGQGFGPLGLMVQFALGLVVAGIITSQGAKVTSDVSATLSGTAKAVVDNSTEGLSNLGKSQPTVGTIGGAVILISLLVGTLFGVTRRA